MNEHTPWKIEGKQYMQFDFDVKEQVLDISNWDISEVDGIARADKIGNKHD